MQVRAIVVVVVIVAAAFILYLQWPALIALTSDAQRGFQNAMASSLRAARSGDVAAVLALCLATFLYGVVHAAGPGHGKIILGATAVATRSGVGRMVLLSTGSALAQALSAILLVGALVEGARWLGGRDAVALAEDWLRPFSYALFLLIGGVLVLRGINLLRLREDGSHGGHGECSHAHGPTAEQADAVTNWQEAAFVILSIAVRPCTGALILLVIAARLDLFWLGALATLTMGLGTAVLNGGVAVSGVFARQLAGVGNLGGLSVAAGLFQVLAGGAVVAISLAVLF
ncbi:nickel/cobalt transporter [Pseudaestuariivita atlantica]|uniref:Nickel/cobalt efflux system n=1 Tax=Pseudaestuariivita atlantica TaxID=1317121 RepID=A0A0L1JVJ0_9RHOB|nr:hypothetical protein [Pseudaestuariivita atlantica]KNG95408.1 hypothetical protein ATO11_02035 [Pseudaestuariivita atlantica]